MLRDKRNKQNMFRNDMCQLPSILGTGYKITNETKIKWEKNANVTEIAEEETK